jgi:hypothetical protein
VSADLIRLMRVYLAEDEHQARARALPRAMRLVEAKRTILAAYEEALRVQNGYKEMGSETGRCEALEFVVRTLADEYEEPS